MRNLYMYYKRLKQYITRKQSQDKRAGGQDRMSANNSSEMGSAPGSRATSQVSGASGQSGVSLASGLTAESSRTTGRTSQGGMVNNQAQPIGNTGIPEETKASEPNRLTAENLA